MAECRQESLTATNMKKIRELKTMTEEVETVYVEYTTVVQQVSRSFEKSFWPVSGGSECYMG